MSHLSWNEQGCRAESEAVQGTVGRQGLLPGRRLRNEYRLQPQQGDVITSLACSLSLYLSLSTSPTTLYTLGHEQPFQEPADMRSFAPHAGVAP